MTLSIASKLVAAFVGLTLLVLAATLGLARWSFEQGFLDYVNALELTRLERVADDLAQEYVAAGKNWNTVNEQRFATLLRRSQPKSNKEPRGPRRQPGSGEYDPPREFHGRPLHNERQQPLNERPPPGGRPPPPRGESDGRPPHDRGRRPPPPGESQSYPPTALYDAAEVLVAGSAMDGGDQRVIRLPIIVDGSSVGELRSEPRREITSPLETDFSKAQLQTSWILGVLSVVVALGLSLLLARGMLAPVRRMIDSVAQLSRGDYSHRMNETRSDELGQLTYDLDQLGSTLEANQSSRKRLLADVSHELRTPLTVLMGEIEALKDGLRKFDSAQLESLDQEVQRLRRLVDDLYELSISDMGGLKYQFSTVDLVACVKNSIEGIAQQAAERGIELVHEFPQKKKSGTVVSLFVSADAQRIDQLLQNLLQNSLAYTDAPGKIVVSVTREQGAARISINDSAPSVDESDCGRLFDPLYRQEASRSRRTGGAGLGLAVCRNIVLAHRGIIAASPSALGGVSMRVDFPLSGTQGENKT